MNINVDKTGDTYQIKYVLSSECGGERNVSFQKDNPSDNWYTLSTSSNILTITVLANSTSGALPRQGNVLTYLGQTACTEHVIHISQEGNLMCTCDDIESINLDVIPQTGLAANTQLGTYVLSGTCYDDLSMTLVNSTDSSERYVLDVDNGVIKLQTALPANYNEGLKVFNVEVTLNGNPCAGVNATQEGTSVDCGCSSIQLFVTTQKKSFRSSGTSEDMVLATGNTYGCGKIEIHDSSYDTRMYKDGSPYITYDVTSNRFEIKAGIKSGSTLNASLNLKMNNNLHQGEQCYESFLIKRDDSNYVNTAQTFNVYIDADAKWISHKEFECDDLSHTVTARFYLSSGGQSFFNANYFMEFTTTDSWIHFTGDNYYGKYGSYYIISRDFTIDVNNTVGNRIGEIKCKFLPEGSDIYSTTKTTSFTQYYCTTNCCVILDRHNGYNDNGYYSYDSYSWSDEEHIPSGVLIPSSGGTYSYCFDDFKDFDCDCVSNIYIDSIEFDGQASSDIVQSWSFDKNTRCLEIELIAALGINPYLRHQFLISASVYYGEDNECGYSETCNSPFTIMGYYLGKKIISPTSDNLSDVVCSGLTSDVNTVPGMTDYWTLWKFEDIFNFGSNIEFDVVKCDANGNITDVGNEWFNYTSIQLYRDKYGFYVIGHYELVGELCGDNLVGHLRLKMTNSNNPSDYVICDTIRTVTHTGRLCDCNDWNITRYTQSITETFCTSDTKDLGLQGRILFQTNVDVGRLCSDTLCMRLYNGSDASGAYIQQDCSNVRIHSNGDIQFISTFILPDEPVGDYEYYLTLRMQGCDGSICETTDNGIPIHVTIENCGGVTCSDWNMTYTPSVTSTTSTAQSNLVIGSINAPSKTGFTVVGESQDTSYITNVRVDTSTYNVLVDIVGRSINSPTSLVIGFRKYLNGVDCGQYRSTQFVLQP